MSRISYNDDWGDDWLQAGRWLAKVRSQALSKRGRQAFVDLERALLEMPRHRLILGELADFRGDMCAVGVLANYRGMAKVYLQRYGEEVSNWGYGAHELSSWAQRKLDVPREVAWMIVEENDERTWGPPEERWAVLLSWAQRWIADPVSAYNRFKAERLP